MNIKQKLATGVVAVSALFSAPAAFAFEVAPVVSAINENFTSTETVAVAVIGGFAGLMVFKLIKRLL